MSRVNSSVSTAPAAFHTRPPAAPTTSASTAVKSLFSQQNLTSALTLLVAAAGGAAALHLYQTLTSNSSSSSSSSSLSRAAAAAMSASSSSLSVSAPVYSKKPVVVTVTGAAGQIGYSIIFLIAGGKMLGPDQPIELRLLDIPPMLGVVQGVMMELEDCAFPLLTKMVGTADYKEAFEGCDVAMLIGARPRGPGMDRKDLLKANAAIFEGQGKALDQWASRQVKVLVVGNPANTNALITKHYAPSLPASAFTAMTRLDQNRAQAQIARRAGVGVGQVKNVIVWGNHSNTQYPDINHASVLGSSSSPSPQPVRAVLNDDSWLQGDFIKVVQTRGAAIIDALKKSSAASAANAAVEHVHDWLLGTRDGDWVSMGVISDGNGYGVESNLCFSFPVHCKAGEWKIVEGLDIDAFSRQKLQATQEELMQERKDALGL